jgi:hypothetical protein
MVALGVELAVIEKSSPLPVRATVCGLPVALSVIESVPVLVPPVVGSKKTAMLQLAFGATGLAQLLITPKSAGLGVTAVIVSAALPVLVTVTVWGRPLVPTYWLGKVTVDGDAFTTGAFGGGSASPVPVRAMV